MTDEEKIKSFSDMVEASRKLNKPWIIICAILCVVIIVSNAMWAFVHYKQIKFAYMNPETYSQTQDFDGRMQEQQHSQGATSGG